MAIINMETRYMLLSILTIEICKEDKLGCNAPTRIIRELGERIKTIYWDCWKLQESWTPNDDDTTNYRKNLDKLIKESSDNTITCYTDGSRTDSGVGAGFLTTTNNSPHNIINYSAFKLPDFCSVFQAEVTAIREVTTTLQHNRSKTIFIWTDSLSSLYSTSTLIQTH